MMLPELTEVRPAKSIPLTANRHLGESDLMVEELVTLNLCWCVQFYMVDKCLYDFPRHWTGSNTQ